MATTRSTTSNQNDDVSWSDPNHDVLLLVMMRLGIVDFPAFSRVCKSWRSLALTNKKSFITSRPPMSITFSTNGKKKKCYLKDLEEREFKIVLPPSVGKQCVGLTCGYLILFGRKSKDFWLVNPITRHQLHFPCIPSDFTQIASLVRAILVFSPSIKGGVFVMFIGYKNKLWFSIEGTQAWNHVLSPFPIVDIHAFKGKIYTLNYSDLIRYEYLLCEMRLDPKLTLLETKNVPKPNKFPMFVSSVENLYRENDL